MNAIGKIIAAKSVLLLFCAAFLSFSPGTGGDSFEIRLNGKKILQQFVYASKGVQTLTLTQTSENDRLDIYYSHCGQVGSARYVTIKNEKDQPVKVWKIPDAINSAGMSFKLKDILGLRKNKTDKLNLFYSSKELPEGRMLASIAGDDTAIARK